MPNHWPHILLAVRATATAGTGSAYAYTAMDANGRWLDGGQNYRLTLPAKNFWSLDLYDRHPDPLAARDQQSLSFGHEPQRRRAGQRRRQHHRVLRAHRT